MNYIITFILLLNNTLYSFNPFELKKEITSKHYKIYYTENNVKLNEKNKKLLTDYAEKLKEKFKENKNSLLVLKGYDQYNDSLEEKTQIISDRLIEIREFLISNGIEEDKIECINYNDITLDPYDDDICDQSDRLVVLCYKHVESNMLSNKSDV